jgi:hypothetical protein
MSELMTAALDAGNQAIADTSTQYVISGERTCSASRTCRPT